MTDELPRLNPQGSYTCAYLLEGRRWGDGKIFEGHGVDAFQALEVTMSIIGVQLNALGGVAEGEVVWDGGEFPNYISLPVPETWKEEIIKRVKPT